MLDVGTPGRPTLAEVLPNCVSAMRGESGSLALPPVRGAVVMLVDGLGASLLRANAGHARHLTQGWGRRATANSFPSTTVSGITSLTTGTRAGEHGMVGYSIWDRASGEYLNQLHGWGAQMPPATWQLQPTMFERLSADADDLEPLVVASPDYADTGFTQASLRGAEMHAGASMAERAEITAQLAKERARPLIYAYEAELDQAGHRHGANSDAWLVRLEELDAAIATLRDALPSDIGLIVTADHGMVDIDRSHQIDLDGVMLQGVRAFAGEPRLRHLYLDNDSAELLDEVVTRFRAREGGRAVVATRDEVIEAGWYGATVRPEARERIGDVVLAARKLVTYYLPSMHEGMRSLVGQHGSITDEETSVPLVRLGAFTPR